VRHSASSTLIAGSSFVRITIGYGTRSGGRVEETKVIAEKLNGLMIPVPYSLFLIPCSLTPDPRPLEDSCALTDYSQF
jgi:hypothetical protein